MARIPLWRRLLQLVIPRSMLPSDPELAEKIRMGLAVTYGLVGWHLAGLMFYSSIQNPPSDPEERKQYYKNLTPATNLKVVRIRGMTVEKEDDLPKQQTTAITENSEDSLLIKS